MDNNLTRCIHWIFVINENSKKYASRKKSGCTQRVFLKIFNYFN